MNPHQERKRVANNFGEFNWYMSTYTALGWALCRIIIDCRYLKTKAHLQSTMPFFSMIFHTH